VDLDYEAENKSPRQSAEEPEKAVENWGWCVMLLFRWGNSRGLAVIGIPWVRTAGGWRRDCSRRRIVHSLTAAEEPDSKCNCCYKCDATDYTANNGSHGCRRF